MVEKWQNLRNEIKTRSQYSLRFDCLTPPGAASAPKQHDDGEAARCNRTVGSQISRILIMKLVIRWWDFLVGY